MCEANSERGPSDAEIIGIWDSNAGFWDDLVGSEGNQFHQLLVGPTVEKLLDIKSGEHILDIACGNGQFSRRLVDLGATVTAFDASAVFIERAISRSNAHMDSISYQIADATDRAQLLNLDSGRFDAAVSNMALMDIPRLDPLAEALVTILKPGARFVFTVMHPCFNSPGSSRIVEENDANGELTTTYAVKTGEYLTHRARKGIGIIGQPKAQYYFHRSIQQLFQPFFDAGFFIDGIVEPSFPPDMDANRPASWSNFSEIPPVLAARLRLPPLRR